MANVIQSVIPHSAAARAGVKPGETLITINGHSIRDVLDYRFYGYESRLMLELRTPEGKVRRVRLRKEEGEDSGLEFETYLMDTPKHCANRCVFCFVDQLPKGMRETLYFKDDDARLSFLMGNYITLTNLRTEELERMIELRISPINVSVHATEPDLRRQLLGNPRAGEGYAIMQRLAAAGIVMNCQIVACPGLNDGAHLRKTMEDLRALYPQVESVSVVPVGLTKHREGLCPLRPYDEKSARETLKLVNGYGETCLREEGSRIFFCSDELFLKAHMPIPEEDYYEEYPQLENGVGMLRLLITEFLEELEKTETCDSEPFTIATGVAAAPFLRMLAQKAMEKFPTLHGEVYSVENMRFGTTIDVAGLVTGQDLIEQMRNKPLTGRLLISQTMLRHGEGVFLDDVTLPDVERELSIRVIPVPQDGRALCRAMCRKEEETS